MNVRDSHQESASGYFLVLQFARLDRESHTSTSQGFYPLVPEYISLNVCLVYKHFFFSLWNPLTHRNVTHHYQKMRCHHLQKPSLSSLHFHVHTHSPGRQSSFPLHFRGSFYLYLFNIYHSVLFQSILSPFRF